MARKTIKQLEKELKATREVKQAWMELWEYQKAKTERLERYLKSLRFDFWLLGVACGAWATSLIIFLLKYL